MKGSTLRGLKDLAALNLGRKKLFRVILMLTSGCPLRCRTCSIWKNKTVDGPTLSELEAFFGCNDLSWINLTGGEIFLREDIREVFRIIADTRPRPAFLNFPTSGFLKDRTLNGVESALRAGITRIHVTVSFDGSRNSHDKLRGMDGSFERAAETYYSLKELSKGSKSRLKVMPGMTLSGELLALTSSPVEELCEALGLEGPWEVHLNLAHASKHYYRIEKIDPLPLETGAEIMRRLAASRRRRLSLLDKLETLYLNGAVKYILSNKTPLACRACEASVFIDASWTAYPCTIFDKPLGNLQSIGFDLGRLASSQAFLETADEIAGGKCPGCWTPCEAYTAIFGRILSPSFFRLFLSGRAPRASTTGRGSSSSYGEGK